MTKNWLVFFIVVFIVGLTYIIRELIIDYKIMSDQFKIRAIGVILMLLLAIFYFVKDIVTGNFN